MRAAHFLDIVILAASATPAFCLPIQSVEEAAASSQLVRRVKIPGLQAVGETVGSVANKIGSVGGGALRKAELAIFGLRGPKLAEAVEQITHMRLDGMSDEVIQYVFMTTEYDVAKAAALGMAKDTSILAASLGLPSQNDIKLLSALAKGGDTRALDALKQANLTPAEIKAFGLNKLFYPFKYTTGTKVGIGAGVGGGVIAVAGAGVIAASVLAAAGVAHTSEINMNNAQEYRTVPGGAIPENDQRQILAAIAQRPDDYFRIMEQVRNVKGITDAEIALFEDALPGLAEIMPTRGGLNTLD